MILSATSKRKPKDQALGVFMKRITHLQLHTKRITQIAGLDLCTNLQVADPYSIAAPAAGLTRHILNPLTASRSFISMTINLSK